MKTAIVAIVALLCLALPAWAQVPFNFPSPTDIEVSGVQSGRAAYLIHLDAGGGPVLKCWRDGGLLEKACSLIIPAHSVGANGFVSALTSPPTYDVRALTIDKGFGWDATPDWSVELGCVIETEELGGGERLVTITDGNNETVARCNQGDVFVGNLFGRVCTNLAAGDCGTFEGDDDGGTWPELKQIIARKGYFGY